MLDKTVVLSRPTPLLHSSCVIYFDDVDSNYRSRFTRRACFVCEIHRGRFEHDVELVPGPEPSWDSGRVFRFVRFHESVPQYDLLRPRVPALVAHPIMDGSPSRRIEA